MSGRARIYAGSFLRTLANGLAGGAVAGLAADPNVIAAAAFLRMLRTQGSH